MDKIRQGQSGPIEEEPRFVIGMDAHSRKLAVSVWDWTDWRSPRVAREFRDIGIGDMEAVYGRHVSKDSLTVIEATSNAGVLKRRLESIGYAARIVRADTLAGRERRRRIRDIQDARNLALAYMRGGVGDFVMAPEGETAERRELLAAYREAVKETTRLSNRIWALCSEHGLAVPGGHGPAKVAKLRGLAAESGLSPAAKMRFEFAAEDYGRMWGAAPNSTGNSRKPSPPPRTCAGCYSSPESRTAGPSRSWRPSATSGASPPRQNSRHTAASRPS